MKKKIQKYIKTWEQNCYFNGIPEEVPLRLEQLNKVPSYKAICIAIMKNDTSLKCLGFNQEKSIFYSTLKYNELLSKNKIKQLKLNL